MTDFSLFIIRGKSTIDGTPGKLSSSEGFSCDTLELPWKDNARGISCIVADEYDAWLWYSPTLKRIVVRLEDKHGRYDCLLHNANFAGLGEGEETQVHGCTAIGAGYGKLQNHEGNIQFAVLNSGVTLEKLIAHIQAHIAEGEHFKVKYIWGDGCDPTKGDV